MANENVQLIVPQTVLQVIEQFVTVVRADPDIPDHAISRLEALLLKGAVPKPDDIKAALFDPSADGEA